MFGDTAKFWLDALQWVYMLAMGLFVWLRKPGEDAGTAVQALREAHGTLINGHAQRLTQIETHMDHMPDEGEFRKLEGQVNEVAQQLNGIRDSLGPIRNSLQRIEDFLLQSRRP